MRDWLNHPATARLWFQNAKNLSPALNFKCETQGTKFHVSTLNSFLLRNFSKNNFPCFWISGRVKTWQKGCDLKILKQKRVYYSILHVKLGHGIKLNFSDFRYLLFFSTHGRLIGSLSKRTFWILKSWTQHWFVHFFTTFISFGHRGIR